MMVLLLLLVYCDGVVVGSVVAVDSGDVVVGVFDDVGSFFCVIGSVNV